VKWPDGEARPARARRSSQSEAGSLVKRGRFGFAKAGVRSRVKPIRSALTLRVRLVCTTGDSKHAKRTHFSLADTAQTYVLTGFAGKIGLSEWREILRI
jgi:hypothetical protein